MATRIKCLIAAVIWLAFSGNGALATTHEFYKGKTIRIVVGYAPGGGYDFYARVIARHMGKHIPGNPTFYRGKHARGRKLGLRESPL